MPMIKDAEEAPPEPCSIYEGRQLLIAGPSLFEPNVGSVRDGRHQRLARLRRRNDQKRSARITVREPSAESASSVTSFLAVGAD